MNKKIFNTSFEISMRLLLLLDIFRYGLDEEKILYLDFFTTYAKNYNFENENINGYSRFMLNEFTAQRTLIKKAIKDLVLMGVIKVNSTKEGFIYLINDAGIKLSLNMSTDYSKQYKKTALSVKKAVGNMSINELKKFARKREAEVQNGTY